MNEHVQAIGIDIGGTKITVAVVDASGRIRAHSSFETRSERGFTVCIGELVEGLRRILSEAGRTAEALAGISTTARRRR